MSESRILISEFGISRGTFSLGPLNLSASKNSLTAIVGHNGSGKTTFIAGIIGILNHCTHHSAPRELFLSIVEWLTLLSCLVGTPQATIKKFPKK